MQHFFKKKLDKEKDNASLELTRVLIMVIHF